MNVGFLKGRRTANGEVKYFEVGLSPDLRRLQKTKGYEDRLRVI
jgi:hypothetical protein